MAYLYMPFTDKYTNNQLIRVQIRDRPDLPDYVPGQVQWLDFVPYPGYYLWDDILEENNPVDFIENYWYQLTRESTSGYTYTSKEDHIDPYSNNTGYWRITDPEHPDHIPEELPHIASSSTAGPSTLSVPRQCTETLESVELSPFRSAPNPDVEQDHEPQSSVAEATTEVLATQFQHILDLENREPENPLTPQLPAYLH